MIKELKKYQFVIIDAGAKGGLQKHWFPLKEQLKLIGFEPNKEEYKKLKSDENISYLNSCLYDTKTNLTLYITKNEGLSSVFMPNYDLLHHFSDAKDRYELKGKMTVSADTLDSLLPETVRRTADFLKIDVEGSAFQVLKGVENTLRDGLIVGLQVEAEFVEKYKGQSLFADVDILLRRYKYQLFDMKLCHWRRTVGIKTWTRAQPVHGDFIYFINTGPFFEKIQVLPSDERTPKIIKFIIICSLYNCYDLALELLNEAFKRDLLDKRHHKMLQEELSKSKNILKRLSNLKEGRSKFRNLLYHIYMILFGIWKDI